ncbi:hypothetical protein HaLaN_14034 [Haematococcus lacustris]|uniref:Uncharacterized protein n=1 Tax=Haematococcus lacustris TaxID=44745 RepID=A0A699Z4A5_HAELA|nr:hypothetical protein HaLaN_14034 [Haematococcus lacustris]
MLTTNASAASTHARLQGCVRDLSEHSFYGLQRSNVLLTTQTKKSAYKWDPGSLQWKQVVEYSG